MEGIRSIGDADAVWRLIELSKLLFELTHILAKYRRCEDEAMRAELWTEIDDLLGDWLNASA